MKSINNVQDLAKIIGCNPTIECIKKAIYDGTSCGAWVDEKDQTIRVGSIVEGCQAEIPPKVLRYPFTARVFWDAVGSVDNEACEMFDEYCEEYCKED